MTERNVIVTGDCVEVMAAMEPESVDAVVTDPPYGLGFMGKEWDSPGSFVERRPQRSNTFDHVGGNHNPTNSADAARTARSENAKSQAWHEAWAREAYRVLRPGGHLLAFGGTRTSHRLACAIEDAGFEIRDTLMWVYASGFPKSLDVSKAIDKAAGATREVVGYDATRARPNKENYAKRTDRQPTSAASAGWQDNGATITAPATPDAAKWQGWGTALKPAHEPIVMARKPLAGTVAANVLRHGTGALNIDGCRIAGSDGSGHWSGDDGSDATSRPGFDGGFTKGGQKANGRWPANVVLTDPVFDGGWEGVEGGGAASTGGSIAGRPLGGYSEGWQGERNFESYSDAGTYSRFFVIPKASRRERGDGTTHPTVKPVALMQHLVRLVTPPGGVVLDPFLGSGTTALAARAEGFDWIGIEREPDYVRQAESRLRAKDGISPLRRVDVSTPGNRWYCTYCGDEHAPDLGTLIDARYAEGLCGKNKRPLVRDQAEAIRLAERGGKLRPKGVPLGGGPKPQQVTVADAARTRAIQEGRA